MEEDGERQLNIGEIARRANVSTATVSRTLNQSGAVRPETARKVWRAATALNYYPNSHARALVSGRSRLLGLIVSDITNPFFPELVHSFEALATQHQYDLILTSTDYQTARMTGCVRRMLERKVDGVAIDDLGDGSRARSRSSRGAACRSCSWTSGRVGPRMSHVLIDYAQRDPSGRRSRRRTRPQANRVHHRAARPSLGADPAAGLSRRHARAQPHSPTRS